jgi:tRNA (pseudouridine54-N1)-methyltransferase
MRQFVVLGHEAPTTADFSLDDLTGGAGRVDVLCRCVTAGLLCSHSVRDDARVHLVVRDQFTVTFDGASVRRLNPDERSTAALVRDAVAAREEAIGHVPVEVSPGVEVRRFGLETLLGTLLADATVVHLHEEGDPDVDVTPPADPAFVLSDHREFGDDEAALLADVADERARLGPRRLHADQAITVAHNYLDTEGYTSY